ncbi:MBL fold metallo-hydrolase [Streptomyces carpinensis]|uniref:MBL fold metallo-hydrolase n=1 Tax=Streptomyces carpinensis TaxID=66369 RepID=A0ABV1W365_9ACTN|nr:MBL fold metallo-hydrolase [Streptomyces carpinensis]
MPTHGFDRRGLMRAAAAAGVALPTAFASATPASTLPPDASKSHGDPQLVYRWLGTAGWRIDAGGRTLLVDPYLTRFDTGLYRGAFDPATPLRTDGPLVDRHVGRPELVLVTHSHWDHLNDVPHIAKITGARVVGTETTYHLLRALGVDAGQLIVVKGGEVLDFDGCVVEAVAARHSRNAAHQYFAPGTLHAPPATVPATVADLPEGDTLAFQVRFGSGPAAFLMGASDFAEREVDGLRPDIAMVAVPGSTATHRYVPRLLQALGRPELVVPVHWDDFETPLAEPAVRDPAMDLDGFAAQVRRAAPASRVQLPEHLAALHVPA